MTSLQIVILLGAVILLAVAAILAIDAWLWPTLLDDQPDPDMELEQLARATAVLTDPPPARSEVDYDQLAAQRYSWHAARRRGWGP